MGNKSAKGETSAIDAIINIYNFITAYDRTINTHLLQNNKHKEII